MFVVQDDSFYRRLVRTDGGCYRIYFSNSLYQYLGLGFPTISRGIYWEYDFVPSVIANKTTPFYYTLTQSV